jgi:hypothetical protein
MAEVGLVLAILPLVISAAERYQDVANSFLRYRRFASEVSNLACRLKTQRVIFVAAVQRLLAGCVGSHEAGCMLVDSEHPTWSDPGLDQFLVDRLGSCREAFFESIRMIQSRLVELEEKCSKFEEVVDDSKQVL